MPVTPVRNNGPYSSAPNVGSSTRPHAPLQHIDNEKRPPFRPLKRIFPQRAAQRSVTVLAASSKRNPPAEIKRTQPPATVWTQWRSFRTEPPRARPRVRPVRPSPSPRSVFVRVRKVYALHPVFVRMRLSAAHTPRFSSVSPQKPTA